MATSEKTICKSILKSLGVPAPNDFESVSDCLKFCRLEGALTLPVDEFPVHANLLNSGVIISFINFATFEQDGRIKKSKKAQNNYVLNTLDSLPGVICIFTENTLPAGKNVFVGIKSLGSSTSLKRYINKEIRGGTIFTAILPYDEESGGASAVYQLIPLKYFRTTSEESNNLE